MDKIQLATPEQVERIASKSDLGSTTSVYAMGEDMAVVRQCTEIDPYHFAEGSTLQRCLLFVWGLENAMRVLGVPAYYFNVPADEDNDKWRRVVETHGAEPTNGGRPEIRYKVTL